MLRFQKDGSFNKPAAINDKIAGNGFVVSFFVSCIFKCILNVF